MKLDRSTAVFHTTTWLRCFRLLPLLVVVGATALSSAARGQTNIGVAARTIAATQQWIVFTADERRQAGAPGGCDLNGDGDCRDLVPYVYDTVAGTTTHLDLAVRSFQVAGQFAAFAVDEHRSGNQDLNGDGDTHDVVLFVYDLTTAAGGTGTATNTGWAVRSYQMDALHVVFTTPEGRQRAHLNADGDERDRVVQVFNLNTSTVTNTGLAADFFDFAGGDWISIHVSERRQGYTVLNGDFDTADTVLFLFQISTHTIINTGRAVFASQVSPEACIFTVPERAQHHTDLNGDGDTADRVVEVYVFATATLYTPDLPASRFNLAVGHNWAAFSVRERAQGGPGVGTDLNGDGDVDDEVLHVLNLADGTVANLATDGHYLKVVDVDNDGVDDFVVFLSSESADGVDYNLDGDQIDSVVRAYDLSAATFTSIASATNDWRPRMSSIGRRTYGVKYYDIVGSRVVLLTGESSQGGTDLNLDGDTADWVVQVFDLNTKTLTSTGLAAQHYEARGNLIGIATVESKQGLTDLNLDGDTSDSVASVYDLSGGLPGTTTTFPIAIRRSSRLFQNLAVGDAFVAYRASEPHQGSTDLNGDGDTSDMVAGFVP